MPSNPELPPQGRQFSPLPNRELANNFTLRDLYVRASISGNSMAAELGRYLNIDSSTFSKTSTELCVPDTAVPEPDSARAGAFRNPRSRHGQRNTPIAVRPHARTPRRGSGVVGAHDQRFHQHHQFSHELPIDR